MYPSTSLLPLVNKYDPALDSNPRRAMHDRPKHRRMVEQLSPCAAHLPGIPYHSNRPLLRDIDDFKQPICYFLKPTSAHGVFVIVHIGASSPWFSLIERRFHCPWLFLGWLMPVLPGNTVPDRLDGRYRRRIRAVLPTLQGATPSALDQRVTSMLRTGLLVVASPILHVYRLSIVKGLRNPSHRQPFVASEPRQGDRLGIKKEERKKEAKKPHPEFTASGLPGTEWNGDIPPSWPPNKPLAQNHSHAYEGGSQLSGPPAFILGTLTGWFTRLQGLQNSRKKVASLYPGRRVVNNSPYLD
ncbi:hypothetical protein K504DRAFT_523073 [Pleomassaria siparia CBS 279.74]|uniref:Uncharacterized protein n=1 Tax=Pleomassaria siparia CBS 279.74 TaxID=1314801 RepID=A0A6G1KFT6_9PLEO|nr:hypothetical protein K504DRAFT_523073 [Pleomassaria siparia CBS 279.74]